MNDGVLGKTIGNVRKIKILNLLQQNGEKTL